MKFNKIGLGSLAMTATLGIGYFAVSATPTTAQAKGQDKDGVFSLMRGVGGDSTSESLGTEDTQDSWREGFGSLSPWNRIVEFKQDRDDDEDIDVEFDFDFDEDFDFDFDDMDFEFQMPDVDKIVAEVMAALKEAGIQDGDKKLSKEQVAKLKARLKERLGGLHEKMGNMHIEFSERFNKEHMAEMEKHLEEMEMHFNSDEFKKMMKERGGNGRVFMSGPEGLEIKELLELRGLQEGKLFELKGMEEGMLFELKGMEEGMLKGMLKLEELNIDEMRHQDGSKLTDEEKKEVKKAMAGARKSMEKAMKGFKSGEFKLHLEEGMKAREKAMQEMKKHMGERGELRIEGFDKVEFAKMMEKLTGENGELKLRLKEMDGKLKIEMKDLEKKMAGLKKFLGSLTDDQKKLAEKQGYLGWDDLTKEQQKLLGEFGKEGGKIQFRTDGQNVVIKKDKKKSGISA